MQITRDQLAELVTLTLATKSDALGCDDCFAVLDQFAQAQLDGRELPAPLEAVRRHLEQCACCADEYDALLTALREVTDKPADGGH